MVCCIPFNWLMNEMPTNASYLPFVLAIYYFKHLDRFTDRQSPFTFISYFFFLVKPSINHIGLCYFMCLSMWYSKRCQYFHKVQKLNNLYQINANQKLIRCSFCRCVFACRIVYSQPQNVDYNLCLAKVQSAPFVVHVFTVSNNTTVVLFCVFSETFACILSID